MVAKYPFFSCVTIQLAIETCKDLVSDCSFNVCGSNCVPSVNVVMITVYDVILNRLCLMYSL